MNKLMHIIFTALAASLVLSVSQFGHVAAMPNRSDMPANNHVTSMSDGQSCEVSHMGTAAKGEDQSKIVKKDIKDTEPEPPYYLRLVYAKTISTRHVITYTSHEHASKVPLYRLCSVIRR